MRDVILALLHGVLPAIAATLILFGLCGRRWLGLSIGVAIFTAFALLRQVPRWPHELWAGNNDGLMWFVWAVALCGVLSLFGRLRLHPGLAVGGGAMVLCGQVVLMLTNRRARLAWPESVAVHAVAALALVLLFLAFRRSARRGGLGLTMVWTVCAVGDAIVLLASGSALQGQLAGTLAACLGTAALTAWWRRPLVLDPSTALTLASCHGGLLLAGHQFGELGMAPALLSAAAPAAMVLGSGKQGSGFGHAIGLAATAALLAAAIVLVLGDQP